MSVISDRSIASRPSLEQVVAIVDFMEKHKTLALGLMRGLEGREESKRLWFQLTRIVNGITGPTRPMKSWIKYWADKKSTVRNKVISGGGDPNSLCSNIEKKIWDLFLAHDVGKNSRSAVKQEAHFVDDSFYNEDSMDVNHIECEPVLAFEEPMIDYEDRQVAVMEKLVKVMSDQAAAMSQMAHATLVNSQAMERLAESSHIQMCYRLEHWSG
ncbi:uncharacterized protein LOC125235022 isoform X2 [Leguminivora glycinivorella]|uniref:uncharacterized protein LOC125235022 isoform X2 n=1 Tax=Leguminivora glycinivorella TaxID=1035111 RepID=UPI00200FD453|nr:uncharacterized protein LOC125235022 isoform X2 [Leguminivora glycinivorella]